MKKEKKKLNRESSELKSLGNELGSFGLEPPKIYRPEQREKIQQTGKNAVKKAKKTVTSKKQPKQLTRKQMAKKRQQKKKLRLAISIICLILALAIALVILSLTVFFKIDTITVKGNEKYSTKEVLSVLPIEKEKNLFVSDTKGAGEKLESALPYIYSADIDRKLPSTIVVRITETPRIYSVKNSNKTYTLLDDNFKVLEVNVKKKPNNSVAINGVAIKKANLGETVEFTNKKLMNDLTALTNTITDLQLNEVTAITSSNVNNNYLEYDGRIRIKIGSTDDIENKVYSALSAIEKLQEGDPDAVGELTSMGGKQVYFTETK